MRKDFLHLEEFRIEPPGWWNGLTAGKFLIPVENEDLGFCVIASDGAGWDHVSVSMWTSSGPAGRCPTWEEMCIVKALFFDEAEAVVQFHPPKSQYVSGESTGGAAKWCLHLWRPQSKRNRIKLPPTELVGPRAKKA